MADPVIRFCRLADGTRVAYSTHGSGPLLVCPAWWVSHLERDWKQPAFRDFFSTLAQHRTVVRYDRPGVGLSSRDRHDFTQETEVEVLDAIVAGLAEPTIDLLAFSCAAPVALAWAAANPGRVREAGVRRGLRMRLGPGRRQHPRCPDGAWSRPTGAWAPQPSTGCSPRTCPARMRAPSGATSWLRASAETAAKLLGLSFALDAREAAARVSCPALVIHRKGDHTVRFDAGRELAADLPNATFLPLPGGAHLPWLGDAEPILSAILTFLNDTPAADVPAVRPSWKRSGDIWTICFDERTIHVKHAKGLADLGVLLSRPGQSVEALELYAGPEGTTSVSPRARRRPAGPGRLPIAADRVGRGVGAGRATWRRRVVRTGPGGARGASRASATDHGVRRPGADDGVSGGASAQGRLSEDSRRHRQGRCRPSRAGSPPGRPRSRREPPACTSPSCRSPGTPERCQNRSGDRQTRTGA